MTWNKALKLEVITKGLTLLKQAAQKLLNRAWGLSSIYM